MHLRIFTREKHLGINQQQLKANLRQDQPVLNLIMGRVNKVPDGWSDIKKAKDNVKYDDIPDPYADASSVNKEEKKEKASLENMGRREKSGTVIQKNKNNDFFDKDNDFDWGDGKVSFQLPL